jgi:hypothetical protein
MSRKTNQSVADHCDFDMLRFVLLFSLFATKMSIAGDPPTRNVNIVRFDPIKVKGFSKVLTMLTKNGTYSKYIDYSRDGGIGALYQDEKGEITAPAPSFTCTHSQSFKLV